MANTGSGEESTSQARMMDDYESLISTTDVELLKRAWRNEKAAPEILQHETSLVQRVKEQIELAEENVEISETDGVDPLTVSLYQMDLDRAQFLLRSYLRIRIQKIEEYLFHIQKSDEHRNRLSVQEQMFAERCEDDLKNHFDETVLSKLPDNYQSRLKQSITSEEDDMVPAPRLDTFVICKANQYLSGMEFEPEYSTEITEMERDLLTFVCYKFIKKPLEKGKIDLV
ncbi:DNA replication complex GINS protein SLD5 [Mercurialis annua]|uniref:DNA replication complex GINS protein SLD5 n=1 Tax=Mercurialis annua TaxID=3986 RepID=UPI002160CBE7|nr:DNA replication complex GINS protein SLD5 [Mercurialis annua]